MATDLNLAFQFENGLAFTETDIAIFSGSIDPGAGAGTPAPRGSLFLRDNGELYIKAGEADTSWNWHLQSDDVTISVVEPSAGLTITGAPIQNTGTLTFTLVNDLAAVEGLTGSGLAARIGADTWATRSIAGTSGNILVSDGDAVAGNPTINLATVGTAGSFGSGSVVPTFTTDAFGRVTAVSEVAIALTLNDLSDVVVSSPTNGQILTFNGTEWVNTAPTGGSGTVTSVAATAPTAGFTITGSPITSSGTLVFALANDLAAIEALATTGIAVRTAAETWTTRSLASGQNITVTSADGVAGNPSIALSGVVPIANGGTGLSALGTALQVLRVNAGGTALEYATLAGGGSVTSVATAQPAEGLTITGSPITTAGTLTFALANDLAAIEGLNGTGFYTRTGTDTWAARSLTQPTSGLTITNPAGTAGNPTFALANDLAAVEGLATTGIAVRTSADTWATRTIQGTTNQITVTNGAGTGGDPTVAIATNPIIPGTGSIQVPAGSTAERTDPPSNGMIRFNTTLNQYEAWNTDRWVGLQSFTQGGTFQLNAYLGSIPSTSGTSAVPYDSTEPLITEGTEIWTRTVVPAAATSRFVVECPFTVDIGTSNRVLIVSLFRDSINLGTALFYSTGGGRPITMSLKVNDEPATTTPVVYSMRAGIGSGTGTWYINATAGGQTLGGKLVSQYEIREFAS